jgi:hypothetical protein
MGDVSDGKRIIEMLERLGSEVREFQSDTQQTLQELRKEEHALTLVDKTLELNDSKVMMMANCFGEAENVLI